MGQIDHIAENLRNEHAAKLTAALLAFNQAEVDLLHYKELERNARERKDAARRQVAELMRGEMKTVIGDALIEINESGGFKISRIRVLPSVGTQGSLF